MSIEITNKKTVIGNFSWNMLGNTFYTLSQWAMLAVIAKLGSVDVVGNYSLGLAITAPILIFTNLQLREIQATDAQGKYNFGEYLGLRIATVIISLISIISIVLLGGYKVQVSIVVLLIGLSKCIESLSDLFYGLFQQNEKMDLIAKSKILKGLLTVIVLFFTLQNSSELSLGVVGVILVWVSILYFYDYKKGLSVLKLTAPQLLGENQRINIVWSFTLYKKMAMLAFPLGIVGLLDSLNVNIPRYFIQNNLGETQLGYYSAIVYLMMAGGTFMAALGQTVTPRLARYYLNDIKLYIKTMLVLVVCSTAIGMIGIIVAVLFGKYILTFLYKSDYSSYSNIFVWVMVAACIWYIAHVLWCGITSARQFKVQTPLFLLVVVVSLIACMFLIPRFGLLGAAYAISIGMLTRLLGSLIIIVMLVRSRYKKESMFVVTSS